MKQSYCGLWSLRKELFTIQMKFHGQTQNISGIFFAYLRMLFVQF